MEIYSVVVSTELNMNYFFIIFIPLHFNIIYY